MEIEMTNHNKTQNRMLGFDPFALFEDNSSFQPGTAELIIGGTTDQVIGRMAAFMLLVVRTHDGKAHFSGITVIAPPKLIWNRSDEEVLELILNAIHDVC